MALELSAVTKGQSFRDGKKREKDRNLKKSKDCESI